MLKPEPLAADTWAAQGKPPQDEAEQRPRGTSSGRHSAGMVWPMQGPLGPSTIGGSVGLTVRGEHTEKHVGPSGPRPQWKALLSAP